MAGGGYYNQHSLPQHAASATGLRFLIEAATEAPLPARGEPLVIADFGVAQGRNSMAPMAAAISALRARRTGGLPIEIVHTDIAGNDFSSLFRLLASGAGSYLEGVDDVYAYAAGRSFYERLFPSARLTLGWSSIAVHWLSHVPSAIPGQIWSPRATGDAAAAFAAQSARDWEMFLGHRSVELRPGASLVVIAGASDPGGDSGADGLMEMTAVSLRELVTTGLLRAHELAGMVIPTWNRTPKEFLAPFGTTAAAGLQLVAHELSLVPDPFWPAYVESGESSPFALAWSEFVLAAFGPSLWASLDADRTAEDRETISAALGTELTRHILADPEAATTAWRVFTMRIVKPAA